MKKQPRAWFKLGRVKSDAVNSLQSTTQELLRRLAVFWLAAAPALAQQDRPLEPPSRRLAPQTLTDRATELRRPEIQILERKELPGRLVREKLRLPGFDPDESVPAIAVHPTVGGPFPVAICLHSFRGAKENLEPWCRDLAARGVFAITIDAHLHGERSIAGIFHGDNIASLSEQRRSR
jgi:hypothetical protein